MDDSGSCSGGSVEFNIESDDIVFGLEEAVGSTSDGSNILNPLSFEVAMVSINTVSTYRDKFLQCTFYNSIHND